MRKRSLNSHYRKLIFTIGTIDFGVDSMFTNAGPDGDYGFLKV